MELLRLLNWPLKALIFLVRWIYFTFFDDPDDSEPPGRQGPPA